MKTQTTRIASCLNCGSTEIDVRVNRCHACGEHLAPGFRIIVTDDRRAIQFIRRTLDWYIITEIEF